MGSNEQEDHNSDGGVKLFGIEWAPLNIPFERRMQTFISFFWLFYMSCGVFVNVAILYYMLTSKLWPLVVFYLCWMYYDKETPNKGGRPVVLMKRLRLWKHFRDYFPISLIKTAELPPNRNYVFCVYPHGFLSSGAFLNFATDANDFYKLYPGLQAHVLTLSLNFKFPVLREVYLMLGGCSVAKKSILNLLGHESCGKVAVLIVGGAAESIKFEPGTYRIVIRKRKGFVKVALESGANLVPVISFGENDIYKQFQTPFLKKFQIIFYRIVGFMPLIPRGRGFFQYSFGFVPHRRAINTVVGSAIPVPKIETPTEEDVNFYHSKFMDALDKLFNEYKGKYDAKGNEAVLIME